MWMVPRLILLYVTIQNVTFINLKKVLAEVFLNLSEQNGVDLMFNSFEEWVNETFH